MPNATLGKEHQHIEIMWNFAVARALILAQLTEKDIIEVHEREVKKGYLIAPFNIQRLFPMKCRNKSANEGEMRTMIEMISKEIPKDIEPYPSHSGSVEWQSEWDWNIFHNVHLLDVDMKKKNSLVNSVEHWQDKE